MSITHQPRQPTGGRRFQDRSFIATLSPSAQINKVIMDQKNLKGGDCLRNWSSSARRELNASITITIQLGSAPATVDIYFPKLAFLAASPVFKECIEAKHTIKKFAFVNEDVYVLALKTIAQWLKDVCNTKKFPELPVPRDLTEALQLRLTAQTLGMHQYVRHIQAIYIFGLPQRIPSPTEIEQVMDNTRNKSGIDPMLQGLANRLNYICCYRVCSEKQTVAYANLLADEKAERLRNIIPEATVLAMARLAAKPP